MRIKIKLWQQINSIEDYSSLSGKIDLTQFNSRSYSSILATLKKKDALSYEEKLLMDILELKSTILPKDRKQNAEIRDLDTKCTLIIKYLLKG